jgi:uncharacterized protein (DUF433 family)
MICGAQAARELSRAGVLEPITMVIRGHKACAMSERYNIVVEDDIYSALTQVEQHRTRRSYNLVTSSSEQEGQEIRHTTTISDTHGGELCIISSHRICEEHMVTALLLGASSTEMMQDFPLHV